MPRFCDFQGCSKYSSYCSENRESFRCVLHRDPDMVRFRKKTGDCQHEDHKDTTAVGASFNFPTERKPKFCKVHRLPGMIDVKSKKCVECVKNGVEKPKQPTYGFDKPTHCLQHKSEEMKDQRHRTETCEMCPTRASYGIEKPSRCRKHKTEGMTDVVSRMCVKCHLIQGVFGKEGKLYCKNCKDVDAPNVKAKMCEKCGQHHPVFNYKDEKKGKFCASCKADDMVDVVNPKCKSCSLFTVLRKEGLCCYCLPTSTVKQKTKEMTVVNFLSERKFEFTHNKSVGYVCGNYRPDIRIDAGTHIVIVEIDEDQHKQYDSGCETARMFNICQAEGMKCVFLRYNPDTFRVEGKIRRVLGDTRLKTLEKHLRKCIETIPKKELTVYRLYYDNDSGETITEYDIGSVSELFS